MERDGARQRKEHDFGRGLNLRAVPETKNKN